MFFLAQPGLEPTTLGLQDGTDRWATNVCYLCKTEVNVNIISHLSPLFYWWVLNLNQTRLTWVHSVWGILFYFFNQTLKPSSSETAAFPRIELFSQQVLQLVEFVAVLNLCEDSNHYPGRVSNRSAVMSTSSPALLLCVKLFAFIKGGLKRKKKNQRFSN